MNRLLNLTRGSSTLSIVSSVVSSPREGQLEVRISRMVWIKLIKVTMDASLHLRRSFLTPKIVHGYKNNWMYDSVVCILW